MWTAEASLYLDGLVRSSIEVVLRGGQSAYPVIETCNGALELQRGHGPHLETHRHRRTAFTTHHNETQ